MRITLSSLQKMAQDGDKITMLTCYDASFAAVLDAAGVDTLLIGDSLGMVLQGHESTLPVSCRHRLPTACVARGSKRAFIIADMPFGSFQVRPQEAFRNAAEIDGRRRANGQARRRPTDGGNYSLPDRRAAFPCAATSGLRRNRFNHARRISRSRARSD